MGFFDTLGKIVAGKPVFDEQGPGQTSHAQASHDSTRTDSGTKVVPQLKVSRLTTRRNGDTMYTSIWVQNEAPFEVELRKFTIMGRSVPLRRRLAPGQGHEETIYNGPIAKNDSYTHAFVDYLIVQNGDYFQQEFFVEFDRQSDGTYLLEELHPENHVRDT